VHVVTLMVSGKFSGDVFLMLWLNVRGRKIKMSIFLTFLIVLDKKKVLSLMSGELSIYKCHYSLNRVLKHEISKEKTRYATLQPTYDIFSYSIASLQANCKYKLSTCLQHHLNTFFSLIIFHSQSLISNSSCKRSEKDISVSKLVDQTSRRAAH